MRISIFSCLMFFSASLFSQNETGCDCWIELDATYTISDPVTSWDCEGGGGEGVDCILGPLELPWQFCFFGTSYDEIYLTSKGTVAFGSGYYDWTPSEFPEPEAGEPQYNHICPFWADFDFNVSGIVFYKITNEAFYLNYIDVGYYSNNADLVNTFQLIITPTDGILGENNVQFCYLDMQWAHGDVGGEDGCTGPTPATVGADKNTGNQYVQFGRFGNCSSDYDGPHNDVDGVNWLDNRTITFNVCTEDENAAPISSADEACDQIVLCLGQEYDLAQTFYPIEPDQQLTIDVQTDGDGQTWNAEGISEIELDGVFTASENNIGLTNVWITVTDNGVPPQSLQQHYVFEVVDQEIPALEISQESVSCNGNIALLNATEGFDEYYWNQPGCYGEQCEVQQGELAIVTGLLGECSVTDSLEIIWQPSTFIVCEFPEGTSACPGQPVSICVENPEAYQSFAWEVYVGYPGEIITDTTMACVEVLAGTYQIDAIDTNGCDSFNIFVIDDVNFYVINDLPLPMVFCDGLETAVIGGGFSWQEGNLTLYLTSANSNGWLGSYIEVEVTDGLDTETLTFTSTNNINIYYIPITGLDFITITYFSSGMGDEDNTLFVFNCSNQNQIIIEGLEPGLVWSAQAGCGWDEIPGTWSVNGPPGWTLSNDDQYNTDFTPGGYGTYELCFWEAFCEITTCYDIIFDVSPDIILNPGDDIFLCSTETYNACADVFTLTDDYEIDWDGVGVSPYNENECATIGPYPFGITQTVSVQIENACGQAEDEIFVTAIADLTDEIIISQNGNVLSTFECDCEYQWYFNGSPIGGTDSFSITIEESGEYSVVVQDECENYESDGDLFEYVNVIETTRDTTRLFPNPFTSTLHYEFAMDGCSISLTDATGRIVFQSGNLSRKGAVAVNEISPGIYTARVITSSGETISRLTMVKF